jgi:SWI/SNF-related matrix-associated actin-dependent regulator 1 of chromatin subfamily A
MQLFPYQQAGAAFLASRKRALLADDMGLGKTAQAIKAAEAHLASIGVHERRAFVGVICPASVKAVWAREFGRWWSGYGDTALLIESYDKAAKMHPTKDWPLLDVLIIDEVHYCKNKTAKRTKALFGPDCDGRFGFVENAVMVFALSGTPTPNHSAELWPMLRALAPETIIGKNDRPMSYWQFVNKFCRTRDNGFGIQITGNKNSEELKRRIEPFYLRRKKEEVLKDLPPIRFDTLPISGRIDFDSAARSDEWALASLLDECTTDEEVVDALKKMGPHVASLRRLTGLAKVAGVVEWVKDWFEGGGGKLVLFAHHKDVIDSLSEALIDFYPCTLTGSSSVDQRLDMVHYFQTDPKNLLFLGQIQAAGTGITLTASSDVLFVESSWVPAENQQAAMRIHRIGQKNACTVRFATLAGSLDERIQAVVARKTEAIAEVFG